jgi:hypothetical protein
MRDVQPKTTDHPSHQILFPLAVGALFVMTLFIGALIG